MPQRVCESLLEVLADAGARDIFGMTGDALNPLLEVIRTDDRFRWFGMRHEENAAYAAYAQAELTGGVGVCAGTTGPGAVHLLNGLYNAKKEGAGLIAITGQVPRAGRGSEFHKEIDLAKLFDDVCTYQALVESPGQVPRVFEIAAQRALNGEVVRIEIPIDVMEAELPSEHFRHPVVHERPLIRPSDEALDRAAATISQGKRTALLCGIGCRGARDEVLSLAAKLQCPIVHTLRAKDIFECEAGEEFVLGMTGLIGNPAGFHAVEDCDVLIMLGTDFPYDEFIPGGKEIVQIDLRVDHIGRRAPVTIGLVGDVKQTLTALLPRMDAANSSAFTSRLVGLRDKWRSQMAEQASLTRTDEPMHPQIMARAVSNHAADDAFFAVDVGECTVWMARQVRLGGGRRMAGSFNHGSVGAGLPVALGGAALDRHSETWALCGDGGFGMSLTDFVSAVRFDWPIKVVVFNNSELGFVKMETEVGGLPANREATALVNPDFAAFAKACGGDGIRVEHVADIVPAIEAAKKSRKPFIIDAIVSSGELTMPPHIKLEQAWGFGISKVKEGLMGLKGDHEVWKAWRDEFKANVT